MAATDKNRSLFLKGFKLEGGRRIEDPTYLGFKIVFDIDGILEIDQTTYIAPSPLLARKDYLSKYSASKVLLKSDSSNLAELMAAQSSFRTVEYTSAKNYLLNRGYPKRAKMLDQFVNLLKHIQDKSPWFFQSISGLDEALRVDRFTEDFDNRRGDKFITINTLESVDLRINALADLYRKSTFDYDYMRELVPKNLRRFNMWIIVTEIRNFIKTARLISQSASLQTLDNFTDLLGKDLREFSGSLTSNGYNAQEPNNSFGGRLLDRLGADIGLQSDQTGIKALMIYHCSQCEFDFDSTYPVKSTIDTGSSTAEQLSTSFRIKIGKIKEQNQYPLISPDGTAMVIKDGRYNNYQDDSTGSSLNQVTDLGIGKEIVNSIFRGGNPLSEIASEGLSRLGAATTNIVKNAVNEMINEGVQKIAGSLSEADKLAMGNIYTFNPANLNGGIKGVSQFSDQLRDVASSGMQTPASMGLLGPPYRVYPKPTGDTYGDVPGKDLGLPDRIYTTPSGDAYSDVPGKDLGLPNRIYPTPSGDTYSDVPGKDLGLPDRIYTAPSGDTYSDVPGKDLGLPDRIYSTPSGDVYPTVSGPDLGLPDRIYPTPSGDIYNDVPGKDLGLPDRIYTAPSGDVYTTNIIPTTLSESTVYPTSNETKPTLVDKVYNGDSMNLSNINLDKIYKDSNKIDNTSEIKNSRIYPSITKETLGFVSIDNVYPIQEKSKEIKEIGNSDEFIDKNTQYLEIQKDDL